MLNIRRMLLKNLFFKPGDWTEEHFQQNPVSQWFYLSDFLMWFRLDTTEIDREDILCHARFKNSVSFLSLLLSNRLVIASFCCIMRHLSVNFTPFILSDNAVFYLKKKTISPCGSIKYSDFSYAERSKHLVLDKCQPISFYFTPNTYFV